MPVDNVPKKKRRGTCSHIRWLTAVLPHEKVYLDRLPSSSRYTKSFMHRDTLSYVTVTPFTDFIITTSVDGVVKFWKKQAVGIEFVKQYRGHLGPVTAVSVSADGTMFVSASSDKTVKIFDVVNFGMLSRNIGLIVDMFNMMTLPYTPKAVCFVYKRSAMIPLLAMYVTPRNVTDCSSDADSSNIYIYNARDDGTPLHTLEKIHSRPVHIISYNPIYDCVVSADTGGMIEYWQPSGDFQKPSQVFEFKSKTDLYDFKKAKSVPSCVTFSKDGEKFVTQSFPDRKVRLFHFRLGTLAATYDESLANITGLQEDESTFKLDTITFGARLSADRELEKTTSSVTSANVIFDESGHFIIYATLIGIKIVNTVTHRMVRLLGKDETHRFTNLALYQGAPKKKEIHDLAMAASENPLLAESEAEDPILFCTAFRKARFFMFTAGMEEYLPLNEMELTKSTKGDRDVYNEKPTRDDRVEVEKKTTHSGTSAVIHTTMGDIFVKLFPKAAPKAVENFATLAMSGYYDGTIFHRVIPK